MVDFLVQVVTVERVIGAQGTVRDRMRRDSIWCANRRDAEQLAAVLCKQTWGKPLDKFGIENSIERHATACVTLYVPQEDGRKRLIIPLEMLKMFANEMHHALAEALRPEFPGDEEEALIASEVQLED